MEIDSHRFRSVSEIYEDKFGIGSKIKLQDILYNLTYVPY
jgi:hypothetical protein